MNSKQATTPRGHIHGLDGLRSLAIIAVLLFHLDLDFLPGGYIGVDVFFVISGYLITTLLLRERRSSGRIDLRGFWTRRARRLLPALVTVVTVSVVLGLVAGNDLLVNIRRQVLGALTFSNNWLEIAAGSSYFNTTSPQLFVNFWSLAVEEQFYLFWPLIFLGVVAVTTTIRQRVTVMLVAAVASALAMAIIFTPGQDPTRVYYGTDTHAFGLLIGAALAYSARGKWFNTGSWRRYRVVIALGGLFTLVVLMCTMSADYAWTYRGGLVLASLATAAVVAALPGNRPNLITQMFSVSPLVWIGQRSYGIYLWHWPVILLIDAFGPAATSGSALAWLYRVLAVVITFGIAELSFRFIETPVRKDGFKMSWARLSPVRPVMAVSAVIVLAFVAALVTAPTKSQVELAMDDAAQFVNTNNGGSASANSDESASGLANASGIADVPDVAPAKPLTSLDGAQMTSFGDSMLYVAAPALAQDFPGIDINAESNRQWPHVAAAIDTAIANGSIRDIVIIAAGTNAGAQDVALIEKTVDAIGPGRHIILVNLYGSSSWIPKSNQNLADVAASRPNVAVADWNTAARNNPDQLQPDNVHPNFEGMSLWSGVVENALNTFVVVDETADPVETASTLAGPEE